MTSKFRTRFELIGILLAIISGGCQASAVPTSTLSPEQTKQISLIVGLDSPTFIKRDGWHSYQPVGFGTIVHPSDLLKTDGQTLMFCPDIQTVQKFTAVGRSPCPFLSSPRVLRYDEMLFISGSRGMPSSSIPYILYPRGTTISDSLPVLRWNDTHASSFAVELWRGTNVIWRQTNVPNNELLYPADAPALEDGIEYLLVVKDNDTGESSNADPNKGLGFQVVSSIQRAEIENQQQFILNIGGLDSSGQKMILALYFDQLRINGRALWGESAKLLAEVTHLQAISPAVHLRSGDSLSKMKLWAEARSEYEAALVQAQSLGDLESQADALAALWQITGDQNYFDKALNIYEQIGAEEKAENFRRVQDTHP